jgi:ABC-type antimicrobial peptide transport system permease subunit
MGMNIGGIAFGVFCVFIVGAGLFYIAGVSTSQPAIVDTYGNAPSQTTNDTIEAATVPITTGETSIVPILLIVGAVFVCCVVFLLYLAAKQFF